MSLYPACARHIYKCPGDPKWKVSRFRLATGLIDASIAGESDTFYGSFWGAQTRFSVFDLDENSQYHNAQELDRLRGNLAAVGLSASVLYQSSRSGGWHLYLPFDDWAPSKQVESSLKAYLKLLGYELRGGQLEIFPSGNALRLPLQPGFAWLDQNSAILCQREELNTEAAVSRFLSDLASNANDWSYAESRIESRLQLAAAAGVAGAGEMLPAEQERLEITGFDDLFSGGMIQEKWEQGRKFWQEGLTKPDQRHDALLAVGHYLWYGDAAAGIPAHPGRFNDSTRARLLRAWLEEKHNGLSGHIIHNRWDIIEADIQRAVLWRRNDNYDNQKVPYSALKSEEAQDRIISLSQATGRTWSLDDWKKGNAKREQRAREAIRQALSDCVSQGLPVTRNRLAKLSGCSPNTVSKHRDLWSLLSSGSSDLSRGGLPISLEKKEISTPARIRLDRLENNSSSGLGSDFQPVALDAESKKTDEDSEKLCLTPSAVALAGDGERLTARDFQDSLPPPPFFSLATGSSTGLEGLRYACGISSLAGSEALAPVFLGGIFLLGLWTSQHRQGEQQSRPGSAGNCVMLAPCLLFRKRTARRSGRKRARGPPL